MKVLVNGIGNIGTTLVNVLKEYQDVLGIDEVHACKRTIESWHETDLEKLTEKGVKICTSGNHKGYPQLGNILPQINYIFEATANGVGIRNKERYAKLPNLIGACAQGSEKGFGISFMSGVNNDLIKGQKFVHIVSCNTHGSAALLKLFCGDELENLKQADMVVVRRSEDISNHQRLVSANVVARHLNAENGTHHSIDVVDMFKANGIPCNLTSSDITTPSQLMHAVRFNIETKHPILKEEVLDRLLKNKLLASTQKFDSNVIFELGRKYGYLGRIYAHAIVLTNNILFEPNQVKGWAFVPQEGNSILSSIHAFLLQTKHLDEDKIYGEMVKSLCRDQW